MAIFAALIMFVARAGQASAGEHEHRHESSGAAVARISTHSYEVPDVVLRDELGRAVSLREVLAAQTPLVVNFIYTSCTSLCPVMTASLLQLQRELARSTHQPRYVSISIDPDFDSPLVLKEYAKKFGADWQFLTGARHDVLNVLRRFDSWRGSKANHAAVTLMRNGRSAQWTRIEGLASARELALMWHQLGP